MPVFGHSGGGGGFLAGKQVFPVDYEAEVSRRLLEASHSSDLPAALECLKDPIVDVNFIGDVCLKVRKAEIALRDESPGEVRVGCQELRTDVTALFLAAHNGNVALVRKLLSIGADVNQKLFKGFATTVAVRENHFEVLEMLLKAGASQQACEEALLEASCYGHGRASELLMGSDLIRPHVAVQALFTACCRGFTTVVDALLKCGVDVNATSRVLLQSRKPALHTNVNCTALVAAIVSRQVAVVNLLLEAGAKTDVQVRLGAWSWDAASGEEIRVGAGLADPYGVMWCAVEYFEESGTILRSLLRNMPLDATHHGRTLVHHAVLCGSVGALKVLLECGADVECPVRTARKTEFRSLHMAARLGLSTVLECLGDFGCDLDSTTETGETGLMICTRYRQEECLKVLLRYGADLALVNTTGQSAGSIARSNGWELGFQHAVLSMVRNGTVPKSSNMLIFSPLLFASRSGDVTALKTLIDKGADLDRQDEEGFSAIMLAAREGHVDAFRLLVFSGANVKLCSRHGDTALTLCARNHKCDLFEKALLEFALEQGNRCAGGSFYALHCAARQGDSKAVELLLSRGYDVNLPDRDGNTPLMLAAGEGRGPTCELLISHGASCDAKNSRGETALSLARRKHKNDAERVVLDELARSLVVAGGSLKKYTKGGRGILHAKQVRMSRCGVLCWGKSSRRNVVCREAEVGPSVAFQKNRLRRRRGDVEEEAGLFRVVTTTGKEVHFVCEGGSEMAEMWVRGLNLLTKEGREEEDCFIGL